MIQRLLNKMKHRRTIVEFYETDLRDKIDFLYLPFASKHEKFGREIPSDSIIIRIENTSMPPQRREIASIILSRKEFAKEFIPAILAFKNKVKTRKETPKMLKLVASTGSEAIITPNPDGTINLRITYPYEQERPRKEAKFISIEKANEFLKEAHFTDEIAEAKLCQE